MISSDIFDTIIGRKYYFPESVFQEIEDSGLYDNFCWLRKHAERLAEDKSLDGIYRKFSELTGCSAEEAENLKRVEFETELEHVFPIVPNAKKLNKDTLLISDTYFNKQQLAELLNKCGIYSYSDIVCSYDGKSSGRVWKEVKPERHIGDNTESDYVIPKRFGINSELFDNSFSENERWLWTNGYYRLAYLCRMARLLNPFDDEELQKVWFEQSQANLPILILMSNYLREVSPAYKQILFQMRDSCFLYPIFSVLNPSINSKPFYASRVLLRNPTESFRQYAESLISPLGRSLIVDLQGTGESVNNFFGGKVSYLTLVDSNIDKHPENVIGILKRKDGFTDKIERLNYDDVGLIVDVTVSGESHSPVHKHQDANKYISAQSAFRSVTLPYIGEYDLRESLNFNIELLKDFMRYVENSCSICQFVNHEVI